MSSFLLWLASLLILAVHEIASALGPDKSKALPVLHAFMRRLRYRDMLCRKRQENNTNRTDSELTSSFLTSARSPSLISEKARIDIQHFFILMYDRASTKTDVNEARKQLFTQKGRPVDAIPFSKVALLEQLTRPVTFGVKCSLQV